MENILLNYFRKNEIAMMIVRLSTSDPVEGEVYLIQECNRALENMLGVVPDSMEGKPIYRIPGMDSERIKNFFHRAVVDQKGQDLILPYQDTQLRLMASAATEDTCICTIVELGEKVRMQQAVQEKERRLAELESLLYEQKHNREELEIIKDMVLKLSGVIYWVYDIQKNAIIDISGDNQMFGQREIKLKDCIAGDILHEESIQPFLNMHTQIVMGAKKISERLHFYTDKMKEEWLQVSYTTVFKEEKPIYAVAVAHKIN